jgi:hypothetical protein
MNNHSIYVAVPDIGDPELDITIENLFESASNPNNIYVGLCHSIPFKNKKYIDDINNRFKKYKNIKHHFLNSYRSVGVSFGRKGAIQNYSDEDFFMQIDSHTMFKKNWDKIILDYYLDVEKKLNTKKIILSAYLPGYKYKEKNNRDYINTSKPYYSYFYCENENMNNKKIIKSEMKSVTWNPESKNFQIFQNNNTENFLNMQLISGFGEIDYDNDKILFSRKLAANFIFGRGDIVKDYKKILPIDTYFFEEEYVISIEAFNLGYLFIYPNMNIPLAHLYSGDHNEFYPSRPSVSFDEKIYKDLRNQLFNYLNEKDTQKKIMLYSQYAGLTYPDLNSISGHYVPENPIYNNYRKD